MRGQQAETLRAVRRPVSGSSRGSSGASSRCSQPHTDTPKPASCPLNPAGCTVQTPAAPPPQGREDLRPCPPAQHPGAEAALTQTQEVGAAGRRRSAVGGGEGRGLGGWGGRVEEFPEEVRLRAGGGIRVGRQQEGAEWVSCNDTEWAGVSSGTAMHTQPRHPPWDDPPQAPGPQVRGQH